MGMYRTLPLYTFIIVTGALFSRSDVHADPECRQVRVAEKDPERVQLDEQALYAFKDLVQLLSSQQGDQLSPALNLFQQKLAKYKKVPREAADLFPEIYAYVTKAQQHAFEQQEYIMRMGTLLPELHDILKQLNKLLQSELQETDNELAKAISPSICNTLDIRTLMCRIGNILIGMEEDLAADVAQVDTKVNDIKTKVSTIDSRTEAIQIEMATFDTHLDQIQAAVDDIESKVDNVSDAVELVHTNVLSVGTQVNNVKTTVDVLGIQVSAVNSNVSNVGNHVDSVEDKIDMIGDVVNAVDANVHTLDATVNGIDTKIDNAVAQAAVVIAQAQNLLGEKNNVSAQVGTVYDIDSAQLTQFEWLKTIARLLLKIECLLHSDCWASCIDTCDI